MMMNHNQNNALIFHDEWTCWKTIVSSTSLNTSEKDILKIHNAQVFSGRLHRLLISLIFHVYIGFIFSDEPDAHCFCYSPLSLQSIITIR